MSVQQGFADCFNHRRTPGFWFRSSLHCCRESFKRSFERKMHWSPRTIPSRWPRSALTAYERALYRHNNFRSDGKFALGRSVRGSMSHEPTHDADRRGRILFGDDCSQLAEASAMLLAMTVLFEVGVFCCDDQAMLATGIINATIVGPVVGAVRSFAAARTTHRHICDRSCSASPRSIRMTSFRAVRDRSR